MMILSIIMLIMMIRMIPIWGWMIRSHMKVCWSHEVEQHCCCSGRSPHPGDIWCFFAICLLSCGCPKDFATQACVGVFAPNSGCALWMSQRHQQQKLEDNEVLNTLFRNVSQYRVEHFVSQLVTVPFQFCPRYVGPILKPICELTMHSSPFPSTP